MVLTYWPRADQTVIYLQPGPLPIVLHWAFASVAKITTVTTRVVFSFKHKLPMDLAECLRQQNFKSLKCAMNKFFKFPINLTRESFEKRCHFGWTFLPNYFLVSLSSCVIHGV